MPIMLICAALLCLGLAAVALNAKPVERRAPARVRRRADERR